jgi:hypothetical protein
MQAWENVMGLKELEGAWISVMVQGASDDIELHMVMSHLSDRFTGVIGTYMGRKQQASHRTP